MTLNPFYFYSVVYNTMHYDVFTESGKRGLMGSWHSHANDNSLTPLDEVLEIQLVDETRMLISTSVPKGITRIWRLKLRGHLKPRPYDYTFKFGLIVAGRAKVYKSSLYIPWMISL